jgi:hypothetical protein
MRKAAGTLLLWLMAPGSAVATTITVPSAEYPTLADAVAAAGTDTLIQVDASLYKGETAAVGIAVDLGIEGINGIPELPPLTVDEATLTLDKLDLGGRLLLEPIAFEDLPTAELVDEDYYEGAHALLAQGATVIGSDIGILPGGVSGLVGSGSSIALYTVDVMGFTGGRAIDLLGAGTLYIQNGSFYENAYGAIKTSGVAVDIDGITFYGNGGVKGPDLEVSGNGNPVVLSDLTTSNGASDVNGGSIYATGVNLEIYASDFTLVSAGGQGGAVFFDGTLGGSLTVDGTTFTSATALSKGGAIAVNSATVDLNDVTFSGTSAANGGAVSLSGATLEAADLFVDGVTASYGGAFCGHLSAMVVDKYSHESDGSSGMATPGDGGAFYLTNSSLELYTPITSGLEVSGDGAVIHAQNSSVGVYGGTTDLAVAGQYGALVHAVDTSVVVEDHVARDGNAVKGSAVHLSGGTLLVQDSIFEDNRASSAGVLYTAQANWVEVTRNRFCSNHGGDGASVLHLMGGLDLDVVRNNVFQENDNADETGTMFGSVVALHQSNLSPVTDSERVHLTNNTFVNNAAHLTLLDLQESRVEVVNNIFQGTGPVVGGFGSRLWFWGDYNLFYNTVATNDTATFTSFPGQHSVFGDPQFQGYVPGDCESVFWLERTSPAVDAGHPQILDLDLSPIYPGATEIPYDGIDQNCDGADLTDVDGDGWDGGPSGPDCDDSAYSVHPGATEIPYDGVDQDCAGGDLVDVDSDGWPGWQVGGADCNDQANAINPDGTEVWYDGVDQDCDGNDDDQDDDGFSAEVMGGQDCNDLDPLIHPLADDLVDDGIDQNCDGFRDHSWLVGGPSGCSSVPAPAGLGLGWLLGVLALVRRRRAA